MSVAAAVLLDERCLLVPTQHGVAGFAPVQRGLQLALVVAVDASSEQMGRPIGVADQHARLTGTSGRLYNARQLRSSKQQTLGEVSPVAMTIPSSEFPSASIRPSNVVCAIVTAESTSQTMS